MTVGEFLKTELERRYIGRTIKKQLGEGTFIVSHVEVHDGGADPQWEISLYSDLCKQMNDESRVWQKENNPAGGVLAPQELEERWRKGWEESYHLTLVDCPLPELVDPPYLNMPSNLPMGICVSGSYSSGEYYSMQKTHSVAPIPEENDDEDIELDKCGSCGENAWDGYICHACGAKDIGE